MGACHFLLGYRYTKDPKKIHMVYGMQDRVVSTEHPLISAISISY